MRILIFGGMGSLGHKLCQVLSERCEVWTTMRDAARPCAGPFERDRVISDVDVRDIDAVEAAFRRARPRVVVNCVGIVKQRAESAQALPSLLLNSVWPHRLKDLTSAAGARLIHISTDCVFTGRRGGYRESDVPDAEDLYGRSKLLGEITAEDDALTLRTSFIGRELRGTQGLLEWFLAQRGRVVQGYRKAVFSGLTANELAGCIRDIVLCHPQLTGLYHVASTPITKHDLLTMLRDAYSLPVEIVPDDAVVIDRSLDGSRLTAATGYTAPSWASMVSTLAADPSPYDQWRQENAV